jgi:predicted RNA-binding Zn-ribbon protein involved in translation (DUF1610 family)
MSNIKKHQCPSCGGNLTVDNDKQMYHCTFCGSTYDYEYFREEQMHEMGETYLSRKEYMAAADAYKFILKKDPHDFIALRGLMLAAGRMNNMGELLREDNLKSFLYNSQMVNEAVSGASEEDKEYFTDLDKIYSGMKRSSDCNSEIESLGKERRNIEDAVQVKVNAHNDLYFKDKSGIEYSPKSAFGMLCAANVIFIFLTVIGVISLIVDGDGRMAATVALFCIIANLLIAFANYKLIYPRVKKMKEIELSIAELRAKFEKISTKIEELNDESDKLSTDIKHQASEFVKRDKLLMRDRKS